MLALGQVSVFELAWKFYQDEKAKTEREVFARTSVRQTKKQNLALNEGGSVSDFDGFY